MRPSTVPTVTSGHASPEEQLPGPYPVTMSQQKTLKAQKTSQNNPVIRNSSFLHSKRHRASPYIISKKNVIISDSLSTVLPNSSFLHGKAPPVKYAEPNISFLHGSKAPPLITLQITSAESIEHQNEEWVTLELLWTKY